MPRNLIIAPSVCQHLAENSTSVVKSDIVIWIGSPTSRRTPQKLPHSNPHFLEMLPACRLSPALQLDNDQARAPYTRHRSNPIRITGINLSLGSGSNNTLLHLRLQSIRGTRSLVRMISGSSSKKANIRSYCFRKPTPPGCTLTFSNPCDLKCLK